MLTKISPEVAHFLNWENPQRAQEMANCDENNECLWDDVDESELVGAMLETESGL